MYEPVIPSPSGTSSKGAASLNVTSCLYRSATQIGIGQADKGKVLCTPVQRKGSRSIRAYSQHLRASLRELGIVVSQTRQLRATKGSKEASQEREHHRSAA
jgi:hypothetical protein